jgi:hypothetical protein
MTLDDYNGPPLIMGMSLRYIKIKLSRSKIGEIGGRKPENSFSGK